MLFSIALDAVSRNKLRALLAVIGLMIGVAAVITMMALGTGAREEVGSQVKSAGTNLVFVRAGNYTRGGDAINIPSGLGKAETLVVSDAEVIAELEGVMALTPLVEGRMPQETEERSQFGEVLGVGADALRVYGWQLIEGREPTDSEVREGARLVLVGSEAAEELWPDTSERVAKSLKIGGSDFAVIGVFDSADAAYQRSVAIPFNVLQTMLSIDYLHGVTIGVETAGQAAQVSEDVTALLRQRHRLDDMNGQVPQGESEYSLRRSQIMPNDFTVSTQAAKALSRGLYTSAAAFVIASMPRLDEVTSEEMVNTLQHSNQTMTVLLASLAGLSLLVGGIGIMNVMLLSVTERTREIGLRMSLGARSRDVLWQFLLEATLISTFGGLVGILAGFISAAALSSWMDWPATVGSLSVALAFSLSVAVGIFFGWYPAHRASLLDPIDALRYE